MEIYSFRHIVAKEQRLKISVKNMNKLETKQKLKNEENESIVKIKT